MEEVNSMASQTDEMSRRYNDFRGKTLQRDFDFVEHDFKFVTTILRHLSYILIKQRLGVTLCCKSSAFLPLTTVNF